MTSIDGPHPPAERLALLCRLSRSFNSSLDLDEVLNRVMDETITTMGAERGFVVLREPGGELSFRVARGLDQSTIDDPQFQVSRSVVERVAREGQPILTGDAQTDDRFSMRSSVMILGLRSILCVPLSIQDRILGVVYVDNRLQAGIFLQADLELLMAIASTAAIAIENARLYEVAVEKGRMERELQMAREVQTSLLPRATPILQGWDFAASWQPAREVAGDYYDFVAGPGGQIGVVVGDVSGKGMHAALFMAVTRSIVRASVSHATTPVEGIANANRLIQADASPGMFVTLFYGLLDPETHSITYVNAGHNPALVCTRGRPEPEESGNGGPAQQLLELRPTGMALGVDDSFPYEQRTIHLEPGDLLLLYTDGLPDATCTGEERFGMDGVRRVLLDHHQASAAAIVAALQRATDDFRGSAARFDDMAILVIKRLA